MSEVAYAVGFNNAKYFSRLFRQTFGRTPSDEIDADPREAVALATSGAETCHSRCADLPRGRKAHVWQIRDRSSL